MLRVDTGADVGGFVLEPPKRYVGPDDCGRAPGPVMWSGQQSVRNVLKYGGSTSYQVPT
jgi:hypothetical protein